MKYITSILEILFAQHVNEYKMRVWYASVGHISLFKKSVLLSRML